MAAFLLALFQKDGSIDDASRCRLRRRHGNKLTHQQVDLDGNAEAVKSSAFAESVEMVDIEKLPICLIACPASVLENWRNELLNWGYFLIDTIGSVKATETDGDSAITRARQGTIQ